MKMIKFEFKIICIKLNLLIHCVLDYSKDILETTEFFFNLVMKTTLVFF